MSDDERFQNEGVQMMAAMLAGILIGVVVMLIGFIAGAVII